ncbi:MAG: hypothetical protein O7I42_05740 [Alphaproteobacteria bacterium]|nr:hypothetical protein [Alphaproteobacteria bacterium]
MATISPVIHKGQGKPGLRVSLLSTTILSGDFVIAGIVVGGPCAARCEWLDMNAINIFAKGEEFILAGQFHRETRTLQCAGVVSQFIRWTVARQGTAFLPLASKAYLANWKHTGIVRCERFRETG